MSDDRLDPLARRPAPAAAETFSLPAQFGLVLAMRVLAPPSIAAVAGTMNFLRRLGGAVGIGLEWRMLAHAALGQAGTLRAFHEVFCSDGADHRRRTGRLADAAAAAVVPCMTLWGRAAAAHFGAARHVPAVGRGRPCINFGD